MSHIYKNNKVKILEVTPVLINGRNWFCVGFEPAGENLGDFFHLALVHDKLIPSEPNNLWHHILNIFSSKPILLRIHSECILGDSFGSSLCDCRIQLERAIKSIEKEGSGMIIYLRQEGRGIGLRAKLSCLALQEGYIRGIKKTHKHTPDEANIALGHKIDERDYGYAVDFLELFSSRKIIIVTGNPAKIQSLKERGFKVVIKNKIGKTRDLTNRQVVELSEKIGRGYNYSDIEISLTERNK